MIDTGVNAVVVRINGSESKRRRSRVSRIVRPAVNGRGRLLGIDQGAVIGARRSGLVVAGAVVGTGVEVVAAVDRAAEAEGLGRVGRRVGGIQAVGRVGRALDPQLDVGQAGRR